jgi:hypothetical protein
VSPSLGHQGFAASVLRSEVVRAEGDSVAQRVARRALSDSIAAPPGEYALLVWNNELAALAAARRVDPDRVVGLDRGGGEVRLERPAEHPAVFYRGHPVDRVLFRSRDEAREPHSSCLQEPIGLGALPGKQSQQLLVPLDAEPVLHLLHDRSGVGDESLIVVRDPGPALHFRVDGREVGSGPDRVPVDMVHRFNHDHLSACGNGCRDRGRRLVMKVSTAAKALGERWRD